MFCMNSIKTHFIYSALFQKTRLWFSVCCLSSISKMTEFSFYGELFSGGKKNKTRNAP